MLTKNKWLINKKEKNGERPMTAVQGVVVSVNEQGLWGRC